ncbi:MAG: response regulator [Hungatella sp.]|nr:response regulator [Hungatella sp.]
MIDIVICDDEVILRNGLKSWVEKSGLPLKVSGTAGNGPQALELIAKQKPFIALMDVNMPGMAGLDVIEEIQNRGIGTRFIIISGHDEFQYARRACHLGVVDYLLKPIDRGELVELLKKVLEQIRKEQLTQKVFVEKEDTTKEKILGYIQDHFTEQQFSLRQLAEEFHLSQSYVTRLIKQETGSSFSELLTRMRIDRAVSLLVQSPDMKLVEIAERTGFASQHYFSRVFKEKIGFSPADYREYIRKNP